MTPSLITTTIASALITLTSFQANIISDFLFKYYNQKGTEYYEERYLDSAQEQFDKAAEIAQEQEEIAQFNKGTTAFEQQNFQEAQKQFEQAIKESCTDQNTDICNKSHYNLGNALYRLGEQQEQYEQKKQHWVDALNEYQQALELDQNDSLAQENAQFVQKKLQQLEQQQREQESQENQNQDEENGQEGESQQSQDGEDSETGESEEQQQGEENQEQEDGQEGEQETEQSQSQGEQGQQQQQGLSQYESQQLDQYMDQLEREEQALNDYFYNNGQAGQPSSPFDDLFNDPFFQGDLFDQFFERERQQERGNSNEKDW